MLVGYNTNISYKEKVYHIQTEDSGRANPVIVTLLYSKGAILASKKTSYAHIAAGPDYKERVGKMMRDQHKEMIKELLSGKHTGEQKRVETEEKEAEEEIVEAVVGVEEATGVKEAEEVEAGKETREIEKIQVEQDAVETPDELANQSEGTGSKEQMVKSLDDILLNYIMKRSKK